MPPFNMIEFKTETLELTDQLMFIIRSMVIMTNFMINDSKPRS